MTKPTNIQFAMGWSTQAEAAEGSMKAAHKLHFKAEECERLHKDVQSLRSECAHLQALLTACTSEKVIRVGGFSVCV